MDTEYITADQSITFPSNLPITCLASYTMDVCRMPKGNLYYSLLLLCLVCALLVFFFVLFKANRD